MRASQFLLVALSILAASPLRAAEADVKAAIVVLGSEAGLYEKTRACQQLSVSGDPTAVPALAALLGDEKLSDYARLGLENIKDPTAGAALRGALPKLKGKPLAGVVDSLAVRRDAAAVPELIAVVRDPSRGAAEVALSALGRIATDEAVAAIRATLAEGPANLRIPAAHAALAAAEQLVKQGKGDAANALLEKVRAADMPPHLREAAERITAKK